MHSDNEEENDNVNPRDIEIKVDRLREQSKLHLNRLTTVKKQLNEINRLQQLDSYVQKLNEIGKIVQDLVQNIRTIEQLHLQLNDKDRTKLNRQIGLLRTEIDREISELHTLREQAKTSSINENLSTIDDTIENNNDNNTEHDTASNELRQRQVTTDRLNNSYDSLEQDIILLHETIGEVAQLVAEHKEKLSHIEKLMNITHDRIRDASSLLQRAVHNKYITVASGALLGASLGGPIGFVMGLKIGALAALSGSAVGALSANIMQHRIIRNDEPKKSDSAYNQAML